ncbi:hypothetical protein GGX14DRAFT_416946 [Mycena pura]|uniref:ORC1/DEAH AAA+ ATPase domain-containing protein n=1 Tax=Mycena pura TaxID=153505 RepID=A0AAD6YU94_9AGAR|nr:hypothetical protein GGX14DRAFT_416946 [Mycena pura]
MLSWIAQHRPRRGRPKPKKPAAQSQHCPVPAPSRRDADSDVPLVPLAVGVSTGVPQRPSAFRPRRQDTNATLVEGAGDSHSDFDTSSFFDSDSKILPTRCASPTIFDSPPPSPLNASKALPSCRPAPDSFNPDDPSLWKKLQQQQQISGLQCFGPVPLDCEPPVKVHRSRLSKLASGTAHSISAILEASIVIGEAANIPWLKGLAGMILLVSTSVQATEDNKVDCTRLSKMVLDIANVAARHLEQRTDPQLSSLGIQSVGRACTRILQALAASSKRSYTRRFIESTNDKGLLLDCEKELQHCLDVFQMRSHIATSVALQRKDTADEAFEEQIFDVLRPIKSSIPVQAVTDSDDSLTIECPDEPVDLPPLPQIFHGREDELSELVQMFSQDQQAHAALMGQGGAGKSTLALALMHQPEIEERFSQRRFLVNCDSATGCLDVLARLTSALGLPDFPEASGCKESIFTSLRCSDFPSLIVFDDFDDVWDSPATKLEVEDLLTDLSNIPTISLLVTLRGTQRPLGPDYTKPYPAPLGGITLAAAREMFFAISDLDDTDTDAPLVDVLLHMVGHLPLAVKCLAQRAQYEPLAFLLEQYRDAGTAVLDGVEASIEKSLYGARVGECPAALEVLGTLARFPEGVPKAEVAALVGGGGRLPGAMVNKCLSVLHKTALAVVVPHASNQGAMQERIRVPEVVRKYLERHVLDGGRFQCVD